MSFCRIADIYSPPGPVGADDVFRVLAEQHGFDVVLPGAGILLMGGQDGAHIIARATGYSVPSTAGHWPHHAVPEKVNDMIKAWLDLH